MDEYLNPLGTDGFEFVEYTAADEQGIAALKDLFFVTWLC
ncbi:4-hydroxyphenylpyruvate dioxygenase [Vibrio ponticus]|nr:4-hydroxyphenylpyruvate dioxygenase [Vibrio ponticus]